MREPTELERVAPRLARAHAAEMKYQRRLAEARRTGEIRIDLAMEEMVRSMRAMSRAYAAYLRGYRSRMSSRSSSTAASTTR